MPAVYGVAFTQVQPHRQGVRQVEPCRKLGRISKVLFLSILALGAMLKQQQRQQNIRFPVL